MSDFGTEEHKWPPPPDGWPRDSAQWQEFNEVRAYYLWLEREKSHAPGSALDDWLEAMADIAVYWEQYHQVTPPVIEE